jgi:hypothetical protein
MRHLLIELFLIIFYGKKVLNMEGSITQDLCDIKFDTSSEEFVTKDTLKLSKLLHFMTKNV